MEHYLQHTELDTPTEKYIEVVFDIISLYICTRNKDNNLKL